MMNRIYRCERSSDFPSEMKPLLAFGAVPICVVLLASCETSSKCAPPVNAAFLQASHRKDSDSRALEAGRTIFVNRCIACHALPNVAAHEPTRIPGIVAVMSHRAHLTPEQKELVTKYLLAVRSQ